VRYKNNKIEELFVVQNNKTIEHMDKKLEFKKGDMIITGISYKYTKYEFKNILNNFFPKVRIVYDSNDTYALALCIV